MGCSSRSPQDCRSKLPQCWPQACTAHSCRSMPWVYPSLAHRLVGAGQAPQSSAGRRWRCSGLSPGSHSFFWQLGSFGACRSTLSSGFALVPLATHEVAHGQLGRSSTSVGWALRLMARLNQCIQGLLYCFAVRPNPLLKLTRYGRLCKPGPRQSYYRRVPGLQSLPPRAA